MAAPLRTLAVLVLATLPAAGCGGDDGSAPQSGKPPAAGTPVTGEALAGASTSPVTVAATDRRQAVLYAGGRSRRNGFARVEFRFRGGRPGYDVRYVTRPVVQDGSGREVRVTGARILRVRIENAIDVPAPEGLTPPGPRRFPLRLPGRVGPVTDMVRLGGFEGIVTWAIGVSGRAPFRVRTAQNPQRLLIDIAG